VTVAVAVATEAATEAPEQKDDEDDDKYESDRHDLSPVTTPNQTFVASSHSDLKPLFWLPAADAPAQANVPGSELSLMFAR
jgi:hypothetical protein